MAHAARQKAVRLSILAAAAFQVRPALAQDAVTLGGVVHAQYVYQLKDAANHVNNFDVTRAQLNLIGRFEDVGTRVTGDVYRSADGSLTYRLKYAFATYTPAGGALTFKLGQIHTPWIDWEERLWDYRMQGPMALQRGDQIAPLSYVSSADFGAGIDGKWGPERINAQLAVVNGESYNRTPGDRRKDAMGRVSVRLMDTSDSSSVGGLRITVYGQVGKPTSGGTRNRLLGMVSCRTRRVTLAAQIASTKDTVSAPSLTSRVGRVISSYGVYRVPSSQVTIVGRVDLIDPNTSTAKNRQTRFIAGASYQLSSNLRLLGDLDHVTYEGGAPAPALEAVRSQALFQVQFTF